MLNSEITHQEGKDMVWKEVIEALDSIIDDYEKVNHLISFRQDDKVRAIGLDDSEPLEGVSLELGSGPGNYSRMIQDRIDSDLVCLDFSGKMHKTARKRNHDLAHHYIRGVFEALPIRTETVGFVTAAYALRDSLDRQSAFSESNRVLKREGKFLLVDIGKPDNVVLRTGMSAYMRVIVPMIGAVAGGDRPINPWKILFDTFKLLPTNSELENLFTLIYGSAEIKEHSLGGLVTLTSIKN
jgi:demethylmenaquinone methyltransferase/2-methoxy-6-polyprenyl-1,4-benzoquinol methylase